MPGSDVNPRQRQGCEMTTEASSGGSSKRIVPGVLAVLLLLLLLAAGIAFSVYQRFQKTPLSLPASEMNYEIPPGTSLRQLAYDLYDRDIIEHPRLFILLGRELDVARRLQAGEYRLAAGMTPRTLLQLLADGKVIQHAITLVEGQTFREILTRIQAQPFTRATLQGLDDAEIMSRLGHPDVPPEGRFLPDTYHFTRGTTDLALLQRAYDAMSEYLESAWPDRDADLPLQTPEEALILASIVEKETGLVEERPAIAGVFIRRLQRGMRLQTDPTVIYGLGEQFDGNLRRRDLEKDTPYNTYTRDGLPPTPIAMPGAAAIAAVLHPAPGDSLYFVSRGDGSHYFSGTLKEHNLAVDKYQRKKAGIRLPAGEQSQ
jgi:UPF0755 protein